MATHNVLIRRRNAANNGYDNILPITTAENVLTAAGDISKRLDKSSFMAFCANVNADSLDAAFGKHNESSIGGLGYQLAMYSKFKGELIDLPELSTADSLDEIINSAGPFSDLKNQGLC